MVVISIDCVNLNHKHGLKYLAHIEDFKKMIADNGGHVAGVWISEAGGSDEVVFLSKWDGIQARSDALENLKKTHVKKFLEMGDAVDNHTNFLCLPHPDVKKEEGHKCDKRIVIRMYRVNGNPHVAAKKYIEVNKHMTEKHGMDFKLLGVLHPIAFTGAVSLITVSEEGPSGMDATIQKITQAMQDPTNADTLGKVFEHFVPLSSRICKPFDSEKFKAAMQAQGLCGEHK